MLVGDVCSLHILGLSDFMLEIVLWTFSKGVCVGGVFLVIKTQFFKSHVGIFWGGGILVSSDHPLLRE